MNKIANSKIIYVFYALLSGTLLGSISILASSQSNFVMSASTMFFWRFLLASLVLLPIILKNSSITLERRNIVYLIITGLVLYGPAILFYFSSTSSFTITASVLIYGIIFVCISLFARLIATGKISIRMFIEITALILGLYFVFANNPETKEIIVIIIGTALYAIAILSNKVYSKTLNSTYIAFIICLGTALFFLGFSLLNQTFSFPNNVELINSILIGTICTALPIILIIKSLNKLPTIQLSMLIIIEPLISGFLKAGGISNGSNLKQSLATAIIIITVLIHKQYSLSKS